MRRERVPVHPCRGSGASPGAVLAPRVCPFPAGWPSAGCWTALGLRFLSGRKELRALPDTKVKCVPPPLRVPAAQGCAALSRRAGETGPRLSVSAAERLRLSRNKHTGCRELLLSLSLTRRLVLASNAFCKTVVKEFCQTELDFLSGVLTVSMVLAVASPSSPSAALEHLSGQMQGIQPLGGQDAGA